MDPHNPPKKPNCNLIQEISITNQFYKTCKSLYPVDFRTTGLDDCTWKPSALSVHTTKWSMSPNFPKLGLQTAIYMKFRTSGLSRQKLVQILQYNNMTNILTVRHSYSFTSSSIVYSDILFSFVYCPFDWAWAAIIKLFCLTSTIKWLISKRLRAHGKKSIKHYLVNYFQTTATFCLTSDGFTCDGIEL